MTLSDYLVKNTLFKLRDLKTFAVIAYVDRIADYVFVIECDSRGYAREMPCRLSVDELNRKIGSGAYVLQEKNQFLKSELIENISARELERIERKWRIIQFLMKRGAHIFFKKSRAKLVNELLTLDESLTKVYVYNLLKNFWVHGSSKHALLSDYDKCGGKGKIRKLSTVNGKRRGRKPNKKGLDVGDTERKQIFGGIKSFFFGTENSLDDAYMATVTKHYGVERGGTIIVNWNKTFTYGQFKYWFKRLFTKDDILKGREGMREYNNKHRPKRNSVNHLLFGLGSRYQIDSTVFNCHLVSSRNRNHTIGKPRVYLVRDTYSRMIVGVYVSTENPSYIAACLALENAAEDKVTFCKRHGILIKYGQWPCHHLPKLAIADNAELVNKKSTSIVEGFGIELEFAGSYRGDGKAIVERGFKLLKDRLRGLLFKKGGTRRDLAKRINEDPRKHAVLTLHGFYKIVIYAILEYNNAHTIRGFKRTAKMIEEDVEPKPIELWNFAMREGLYAFAAFDRSKLWQGLLPKEPCVVDDKGIQFMGRHWSSKDSVISKFIHERSLNENEVLVAYDPRYYSEIFLVEGKEFHRLVETGSVVEFENFHELSSLTDIENEIRRRNEPLERSWKVKTNKSVKDVLRDSFKARGKGKMKLTDTNTPRAMEKLLERREELDRRNERQGNKSAVRKTSNVARGRMDFADQIKRFRKKHYER